MTGEVTAAASTGVGRARSTPSRHRALRAPLMWIVGHELWITLAVVPLLIFPHPAAPVALGAIPCLWLLRWAVRGQLTVRTPVDIPVLAVLVTIPLSVWASPVPSVTFVSLCQVVAGVALFYAVVNSLRTSQGLFRAALAVVLLGAGLALVGLVSTDWGTGKVLVPVEVYRHLPLLLPERINANVLAGSLLLLIPLAAALLVYGHDPGHTLHIIRLQRALASVSLVVMLVVFLLTQSRGGYVALVPAMLVVLVPRFRWLLVPIPVALAAFLVGLQRVGAGPILDSLLTTGTLRSWAERREIWSGAVSMIQDFPVTGIGLGAFGRVQPVMYPYLRLAPKADVPHAHNLFLQVGVDLGIPGLIAFLALLFAALLMSWRGYLVFRRRGQQYSAGIALGLFAGLLAMVSHGMVDAVTWGTKPSIIPWVLIALAALAYGLSLPVGLAPAGGTELKEAGQTTRR